MLFCLTTFPLLAQTSNPKKNVVIFLIDDLRPMLSSYGNSWIQTPYIDALAKKSIQFNRAYCNVPVCGASRASILTGIRPARNRFLSYDSRIDKDVSDAVITLPQLLKQQGYKTISNGKVSHHSSDRELDWNEIWNPKEATSFRDYANPKNKFADKNSLPVPPFESSVVDDAVYFDGKTAKKTIRDIEIQSQTPEPFFIVAGFRKPHLPFNAPKKYWDLYEPSSVPFPSNDKFPVSAPEVASKWYELPFYDGIQKGESPSLEMKRKLIHGYAACVSYVDQQVGKVIAAIDQLGLRDDTVVLLMSDHGFSLSEHNRWAKHALFEIELQIPLLISIPKITGGEITNSFAELVDIYPTLCDVLQIPKPIQLQGISLMNALKNPSTIQKKYAFSRYHRGETLISERYSYSEWKNKKGMITGRMLYDLQNDPGETTNLSQNKEYSKLVDSLSNSISAMSSHYKTIKK